MTSSKAEFVNSVGGSHYHYGCAAVTTAPSAIVTTVSLLCKIKVSEETANPTAHP